MGHTVGFATQVWQVWVRCQICQPTPTPHPSQVTCGSQPPIPTLIHICCLTHFNGKLLSFSPAPAISHLLPPHAAPSPAPHCLKPASHTPSPTPCHLKPALHHLKPALHTPSPAPCHLKPASHTPSPTLFHLAHTILPALSCTPCHLSHAISPALSPPCHLAPTISNPPCMHPLP